MICCLSVLKTLEWNAFLQTEVKIQAKNCQRLFSKKTALNAGDEEMEWRGSHRAVIYTGKLHQMTESVFGIYHSLHEWSKITCCLWWQDFKKVSVRSKIWHCWQGRICLRSIESQRLISFFFLCLCKKSVFKLLRVVNPTHCITLRAVELEYVGFLYSAWEHQQSAVYIAVFFFFVGLILKSWIHLNKVLFFLTAVATLCKLARGLFE